MSKTKIRLNIVKYNALKLRSTYQLPYYLVYLITKLTGEEEIDYVQFLMCSSEHLLRSKGYYKKYPQVEKEVTKELKDSVTNRTYCLNI